MLCDMFFFKYRICTYYEVTLETSKVEKEDLVLARVPRRFTVT